jgi:hypothetical protein
MDRITVQVQVIMPNFYRPPLYVSFQNAKKKFGRTKISQFRHSIRAGSTNGLNNITSPGMSSHGPQQWFMVKFMYSERATKIWQNLPILQDVSSKKVGTFFQIFMTFSELMNLRNTKIISSESSNLEKFPKIFWGLVQYLHTEGPRYLAILLCANFVSTPFQIGSKKIRFKLFR